MYQFFNFFIAKTSSSSYNIQKQSQSPCWSYPVLVLKPVVLHTWRLVRSLELVEHILQCLEGHGASGVLSCATAAMVKSQDMHWEIGNKNYRVAPTHYRSMIFNDGH
jgi:hypothetical protein